MPKRKCSLTSELQQEYPFLKPANKLCFDAICSICSCTFSVAHGGRSDINDHIASKKHKTGVIAKSSSSAMSVFFKKKELCSDELKLAAAEGVFAYHTVQHNHSFRSMDCTSKLVKKVFDPKFGLARTKTEAIVVNILDPFINKCMVEDIQSSKFVSLAVDTSNHTSTKLAPVLVRYFSPLSGIKTKIAEFSSIGGETSATLCEHVMSVVDKLSLRNKIIAFSADNTNTNFGGVARTGVNNVHTRLKDSLGRDCFGIGCGAHIVHNSSKTACDQLPVDVEMIVNKIFSYFHIYTVRCERLKEFCESVDIEYHRILSSGKTRWLSLLPGAERIILMFEPLQSFFLSEAKCPVVLKKFFEDPCSELWLWFIHSQLALFNVAVLNMEGNNTTVVTTTEELQRLTEKLQTRKDEKFFSMKVKSKMRELEANGRLVTDDFIEITQTFYDTAVEYLNVWRAEFGRFELFGWTNLTSSPVWVDVERSLETFASMCQPIGVLIDDNSLFDELSYVRNYVTAEKLTEWQESNATVDGKWVDVFTFFRHQNIAIKNVEILVEFVLSIPATNAEIERVFSMMKQYWTDDKSRLKVSTLKSILSTKFNCDETCCEMYDKILQNRNLLQKIHSSEKYQ